MNVTLKAVLFIKLFANDVILCLRDIMLQFNKTESSKFLRKKSSSENFPLKERPMKKATRKTSFVTF